MKYRAEIDGLRAIAVTSVMVYHAGVTFFGGGYAGVDVFFVISGFLITTLIIEDLEAGTFSFARFYERRARRILPALLLVMVCCIPFAVTWMQPVPLRDFSQSLIAVSLFVSNLYFWRETGYFAADSAELPLLHTWSLAVEEQFYFFFPLFLVVLWRVGRRPAAAAVLLVAFISLLLSEWGWRNSPVANFYFTPTRVWELFAGALCAFACFYRTIPGNGPLAACGLAMIAATVFWYDDAVPFPSVYTLLPVGGTALILIFGKGDTRVGRALSMRWLVGLGLISYSAYLWHQPVLAFARIRHGGEPALWFMVLLLVASFVLAWASWKFVETPFRRRGQVPGSIVTRRPLVFGAGAFTVVCIAGALGHATTGFAIYYDDAERLLLLFEDSYRVRVLEDDTAIRKFQKKCFLDFGETMLQFEIECSLRYRPESTVIWGDSIAGSVASGFLANDVPINLYTSSGCPPVAGLTVPRRPNCEPFNELVFGIIESERPQTVVLNANWDLHLPHDWGTYQSGQRLIDDVRDTVATLLIASPDTKIIVIGLLPQWHPSLPVVVFESGQHDPPQGRLFNERSSDFSAFNSGLSAALAGDDRVVFFDPMALMCETDLCQAFVDDGQERTLMVWDYGHLTRAGSAWFYGHLKPVLQ